MKLTIKREERKALYYPEDLGNGITLDMLLIPEGTFLMGSPQDEPDRRRDVESPQHEVTVPSFFMGKYPVTQAQWQAVAALPKINRDLQLNPSSFKGGDRPVENVSWHNATEFCDRLTQKTSRSYRLPSEAEWEYACRAGTTTPFYWGETITTDLANYDGTDDAEGHWSGSYDRGPKGIYRQETTPVGTFPANAFGLYDMHGNVWEWCQDIWHNSYEGAPKDGSAWIDAKAKEDANRVLRGGSWNGDPRYCRSASRDSINARFGYFNIGFRVACSAPRTL
jgi:formylglycine-generating enzyme required for sulfatase activity